MSEIEHYVRPEGMPPGNGYSHAVAASGRVVAVSGQLPLDAGGTLVGAGDAAGASMEQVVKLTVFLTDLGDLPAFREVRDSYVSVERPPASSLVQVSGLVHPEARVEIEASAVTSVA